MNGKWCVAVLTVVAVFLMALGILGMSGVFGR
jgi:hypothetical protein